MTVHPHPNGKDQWVENYEHICNLFAAGEISETAFRIEMNDLGINGDHFDEVKAEVEAWT